MIDTTGLYLENYGIYKDLIINGGIDIDVRDFTKENFDSHFYSILNIMRDGIERPDIQNLKITVHLADGEIIRYTIVDYWFNLIFWTVPIYIGLKIDTRHIVDTRTINKRMIKKYYDDILRKYDTKIDFIVLNNILDESLHKMKYINIFAMYLANTVNFRDTIDLMKQYPDFYDSIHADLSNVPIEDIKNVGMKYAQQQINRIKNSDHCLRDSFTAGEGINPKQFKEVQTSIGTKPDGQGGVYPWIINRSFINGGVSDPVSYTIDSAVGRTAQILQKMNVGTSGAFARLLETNNLDTFFNLDENYSCDTKNFIEVYIKDASWLRMYDKRWYRFNPDGPEYVIDAFTDDFLIGKMIYVRSPITCASYARGQGICAKCYGNLYHTNKDINPGKIAAELLSSIYTQMLLSAKHLLESSVIEMKWADGFKDIFEVNLNTIGVQEDGDFEGMFMILDPAKFDSSEDDDDESGALQYDEYTPDFEIMYKDGTVVSMHTSEEDNIYLTEDLNKLLKSKKIKIDENDKYIIPLELLKTIPMVFTVKIQNKELQRTLERSKHIIDREKDTSTFTKDTIVREFITANTEGNINLRAIHLEVLIANQMRDPDNIFDRPHWWTKNCPYKILTLSSSLTNSPSIMVTLEYQRIARTLVSPLSTKKKKASIFDVFAMEQPQQYAVNKQMISDDYRLIEDNDDEPIVRDAIYSLEKDKSFQE